MKNKQMLFQYEIYFLLNKLNIYGGYCLKNNYKEFIISDENKRVLIVIIKKGQHRKDAALRYAGIYILNLAPTVFAAASRRRASAA